MIVLFIVVGLALSLLVGLLWASGGQTVYSTQGSGIIEAIPDALEAEPVPPSGRLVILSLSLAYGLGPPQYPRAAPNAASICDQLDGLIETIVASGADIALLQEVDFASQRTYDIDQLYYIAAALGWGYAARAVTWECRYFPWPWHQPSGRLRAGMGVISRYPLIQNVRYPLPQARAYPGLTRRFWPRHTVQMVDVQCGGTSLRLFNASVDSRRAASGQQQIEALVSFVRDAYTPASVLMGALNPSVADAERASALSLITMALDSQFQALAEREEASTEAPGHSGLHQAFVGPALHPLTLQRLAIEAPMVEHAPLALHLRWALAITV
jgi:endonuclease/exonuclease/phosphatase family metal-dependent hydrolase